MESLATLIHFDKNRPQNQNIFLSNLRSKYIMIHDGKSWLVKDRKDIVEDLYEEKEYIIFNKIDELCDELPVYVVNKFDKIKNDYDSDKIKKVLLNSLDMTLYNKKNIPFITHKLKDTT